MLSIKKMLIFILLLIIFCFCTHLQINSEIDNKEDGTFIVDPDPSRDLDSDRLSCTQANNIENSNETIISTLEPGGNVGSDRG